jgi:hypothetical protein
MTANQRLTFQFSSSGAARRIEAFDMLRSKTMMIALILGSWVGISVLFCVAVARVASTGDSDAIRVIEVPPAEDISFTLEVVSHADLTPVPALA